MPDALQTGNGGGADENSLSYMYASLQFGARAKGAVQGKKK